MKEKKNKIVSIFFDKKRFPKMVFVSFLYSLFYYIGHSIEVYETLAIKGINLVSNILLSITVFALTYLVSSVLYYLFDIINIKEKREWRNPFILFFFSFLFCFLPIIIISYPAVFMGDNLSNICQTYPELGIIEPDYVSQKLISENVFLNNHHPLVHTLFIHFCIEFGRTIFSNANIGLLIYSIIQSLVVIVILSYSFSIAVKETKVPRLFIFLFFFYIVLSPYIRTYLCLITKDSFYGAFFLLFLCNIYKLFYRKNERKRKLTEWIIWALSIAGIVFLRNDGIWHLLLFTIIWVLIDKNMRKVSLISFVCIFVVFLAYMNLLLPAMKVVSGSKREMLSVPFQQTARYVKYYEKEVTEEEKDIIDGVLDYENIADLYRPGLSDPVKATYKENATGKDLKNYFVVWLKMGLKHPIVYFDSFFANYNLYFYPTEQTMFVYNYRWSDVCMDSINSKMTSIGISFSINEKTRKVREEVDYIDDMMLKYYPSKLVGIPALYLGLLLISWGYAKDKSNLSIKVMEAFVFLKYLFYLVGPTNADYSRYMFPIVLALPLLLSVLLFDNKKGEGLSND